MKKGCWPSSWIFRWSSLPTLSTCIYFECPICILIDWIFSLICRDDVWSVILILGFFAFWFFVSSASISTCTLIKLVRVWHLPPWSSFLLAHYWFWSLALVLGLVLFLVAVVIFYSSFFLGRNWSPDWTLLAGSDFFVALSSTSSETATSFCRSIFMISSFLCVKIFANRLHSLNRLLNSANSC